MLHTDSPYAAQFDNLSIHGPSDIGLGVGSSVDGAVVLAVVVGGCVVVVGGWVVVVEGVVGLGVVILWVKVVCLTVIGLGV